MRASMFASLSLISYVPVIIAIIAALVIAIIVLQRSRGAGLLLGGGCLVLIAEAVVSFTWSRLLVSILERFPIGIEELTPIFIVVSLVLSVMAAGGLALCIAGALVGRSGQGRGAPPSPPRPLPGTPYPYQRQPPPQAQPPQAFPPPPQR